jgi:hypothetical protein
LMASSGSSSLGVTRSSSRSKNNTGTLSSNPAGRSLQ